MIYDERVRERQRKRERQGDKETHMPHKGRYGKRQRARENV